MTLFEKAKQLFGFTPTEPPATVLPGEPAARIEKPTPAGPPPAAQLREQILRFIVGKLYAYQNEPDNAPVGLRLVILCTDPNQEVLYTVALWANQPGKFQAELVRQLADQYITLPKNWLFEYAFFTDALPETTYREGNLGLVVADRARPDHSARLGKIVALVGQLAQPEYILDPAQQTQFTIGRGQTTQTASGRVRTNTIVIVPENDPEFDPEKGAGNGAVSRAHATICYDYSQKRYTLLVDAGGLPAGGNKTKLIHPDNTLERADIGGMHYPLQHGDQLELGGEVMLLFTSL